MDELDKLRADLVAAMEAVQDEKAECEALREERVKMQERLDALVGQRNRAMAALRYLVQQAKQSGKPDLQDTNAAILNAEAVLAAGGANTE